MERADLMKNDIIYQKAVELFEQEDFDEAVELFIQLYESDYEKDVIIHIGDNHMHNAEMIKVIEKYGR